MDYYNLCKCRINLSDYVHKNNGNFYVIPKNDLCNVLSIIRNKMMTFTDLKEITYDSFSEKRLVDIQNGELVFIPAGSFSYFEHGFNKILKWDDIEKVLRCRCKVIDNIEQYTKQQMYDAASSVHHIFDERHIKIDINFIDISTTEKNDDNLHNIKQIYQNGKCCICDSDDESILLIPCRHMVCVECSKIINKCPMCNNKIDMNVKIK